MTFPGGTAARHDCTWAETAGVQRALPGPFPLAVPIPRFDHPDSELRVIAIQWAGALITAPPGANRSALHRGFDRSGSVEPGDAAKRTSTAHLPASGGKRRARGAEPSTSVSGPNGARPVRAVNVPRSQCWAGQRNFNNENLTTSSAYKYRFWLPNLIHRNSLYLTVSVHVVGSPPNESYPENWDSARLPRKSQFPSSLFYHGASPSNVCGS